MTVGELKALIADMADSAQIILASGDGLYFVDVTGQYYYIADPRDFGGQLFNPDQNPKTATFIALESSL